MSKSRGSRPAFCDDLIPFYVHFVRQHRGRRTTHQLHNTLNRFCDWLACKGVSDPQSLTAVHVRDFIASLRRFRPATIAVHASALRGFLKYLRLKEVLNVDLSPAVERPRLYRWSQPPEVLDAQTIEHILGSLERSTPFGKRDYAILLLAARYGLRSSDIRSLRFEDIRWRERRIVLLQSKTQRPLELPLMADVGGALVDYIREGRPACDVREIFVRHKEPIAALAKRNNLWPVMQRALKAAGVDVPGRRGLQLLRHSLATHMLAGGVALDTISDVLGHSSVEVTQRYTQVDLSGLRSVALSEAEVQG